MTPKWMSASPAAEFILTNKLNITRARMHSGLKFIGLTATGTNNVDLEAAKELGVAVCNITNYCTVSVTQHVLGSILALTHRLREYHDAAVDGTWARCEQFSVPGPADPANSPARVLGIVGHGTLGKSVAKACRDALGMRILGRRAARHASGTRARHADVDRSGARFAR
jgi:glycerate dehydrogenase